jgi:uncharacterized protein (TIGR00297 family)
LTIVTPLIIRLLTGLIFSSLIGLYAYRRGSLARSGVLGAVLTGTAIFGFGGWSWGLLLITFFVTSSLLSRYKESQKERIAAEKFDKGGKRDIWQALANAGAGSLIAAATLFIGQDERYVMLLAAFVGAMATVNADTWATEIGVLAPGAPRLITTGKRVEPGTSGGISVQGTLASLAGATVIGFAALFFLFAEALLSGQALPIDLVFLPLPVIAGGLAGSLFDSLLGATVQAIYYSPHRQKETEKRIDPNGKPNDFKRGWRWLNNDWVNYISSVFGAVVAAGLWQVMGQ